MKKAVSRTASVPAPIGGWNTISAIADMPPADAILLDNLFPQTSDVRLRKGSQNHVTGLTGAVDTLMSYTSATAKKLFAAANNAIYDVTTAGAVGAAVVSAQTSNRYQHINIGTSGGQYLYAVNGADKPLLYDGTTWTAIDAVSTPAITGVTTTNLIHINAFKRRVFFVEKNTLKAWYLPTDSVGGAAAALDFSSICRLGGYLVAMGTWTLDGGSGIDDHAVWVTSEGEVIVYKGTDPASASTWSLVGVFRVGKPVGRRCLVQYGGDLILICQDGFIPLSRAVISVNPKSTSITAKIANAVTSSVASYGSNFGWQGILHPAESMLIFNVPVTENSEVHQYVMNTLTGAWCRFKGWNANCWERLNDSLYYGGNGVVIKANAENSDLGANITGDAKTAFSYFGNQRLKRFTMARPVLLSDGNVGAAMEANIDYEDRAPTNTPTFSGAGGALWDVATWDVDSWGGALEIKKDWQSIYGLGYAAALRMQLASNVLQIYWQSTDWMFEPGGIF